MMNDPFALINEIERQMFSGFGGPRMMGSPLGGSFGMFGHDPYYNQS